jgi:hypothetical protein
MNTKTLLVLFSLALLILTIYSNYRSEEGFQAYTQLPYGSVKTGADPIYVYRKDRYRKPYRYPFKFFSTYPYPHQEPGP